jgi:hypothetical protein
LTVFHRQVPQTLPPGPVMVIEPVDATLLWRMEEPLQNPVVAKQQKESPLLAHVQLERVLMPEARKLVFNESESGVTRVEVLVETATGDPLYAVIDRPEGKVVVLTVNLDLGDLPLQTAFPILMTNMLGSLAGNRNELREALSTGAVTTVNLPTEPASPGQGQGAKRVLLAPDGRARPLPGATGRVAVGPLDSCGVWSIVRRTEGQPDFLLAELACNLASRRESDLRPAAGLAPGGGLATAGFGTRPIWYYLIASAWLLTCWEWMLYQRRWID